MKKILIVCLVFFVIGVSHGCYYDKEQLLIPPKTASTCTGIPASFANDVAPLIQSSCSQSGCHNAGSSSGPGALTTYSEISNASAQIQSSIQAGRMPLGSSLSAAQIQTIVCWISNGKLNN
ncbi:MAG: hypothetical protein JST75_19450 [Bacteroidetes bacterium]|nr:hypothetical protein [Bacteroidota bacterium]